VSKKRKEEKALSCPLCQKSLSERSQEELWRMAQGEILAAYSKYFPETKGVEGVWRCETHGDWVLVHGERREEEEREKGRQKEKREKREREKTY
jgi:ribosomal protein L37AE/L43A